MSDFKTIKPNEPADFTPSLGDYKTLQPFRYWCQKVLPLVYDDSLSYYELLCKVVDYLNKTMSDVETLHGDVTNIHTAYEELQNYVNNYFSTLDVQQEIDNKLDELVSDGTLTNIIGVWLYGGYSLWIGDSYVQANSLGTDKDKRFSSLVSAELKTTELNYAIGGTGYSTSNNFLSQITKAYNENKNIVNEIKYIFVGGGRNDAYEHPNYSFSEMRDFIEPVYNFAKTYFPNAKVYGLPMMFDCTPLPYSYTRWKVGICSYLNTLIGSKIIDLSVLFYGDSSYILDDNIHPNVNGHRRLASAILTSLYGGDYKPFYVSDFRIDGIAGKLYTYQFGNSCGIKGNFTTSRQLTGTIYTLETTGVLGYLGYLCNIPMYNMTDGTIEYVQYKGAYSTTTHKFTITLTLIKPMLANKTYFINFTQLASSEID